MRINLISIWYWPERTGIGPYAAGAAEYLASHGDTVTAIVGMPHFPAWKKDTEFRTPLRESEGGVRILRFDHFVPSRHNALQRARYEMSFFLSVAKSPRLPRADVSVAVVPNLAAAYIALVRRRRGGPYGVIVQDVSSRAAAQSGTPGGGLASRITSILEGAALRPASFVGLVSPAFATPVLNLGVSQDRVINVPNWTHVAPPSGCRDDVRKMMGWHPDTTIALHAGNMGRKQALETVVDSARKADALRAPIEFVLMGEGNQRKHLEEYARGVSRLRFLPSQSEEIFPDVLAAADVLLLSERSSVTDMSLPSKLTSYFRAGRPVIGAIPAHGSSATELLQAGAGVVVEAENSSALLDAVLDMRRSPELALTLGNAGSQYSEFQLQPERTLKELRRAIHAIGARSSRSSSVVPGSGQRTVDPPLLS